MARSPTRESTSVVIGPMVLPEPIAGSGRAERCRGGWSRRRSISTSASIQVAPGSSIVTPARMWASEDPPARLVGDPGEVGAVVDPEVHRRVRDAGRRSPCRPPGGAAAARRAGSTRPGRCRWSSPSRASASGAAVECVGPGVDLLDRELLGGGVAGLLRLDDPLDVAVRRPDDPAVGAGVLELGGHHGRGGVGVRDVSRSARR